MKCVIVFIAKVILVIADASIIICIIDMYFQHARCLVATVNL